MTAAIKVLQPGLHTTVQDSGRTRYQDVGVPVSGPLDRVGLRLANALVGNEPDTSALEIMLQGPAFEVLADSVRIALAGCNGVIHIGVDGARKIPAGRSVWLARSDMFRVTSLGVAGCGYLAIEGGIDAALTLGSTSTYVRGGLGGYSGYVLRAGEMVPLKSGAAAVRAELALAEPFDLGIDRPIRVVLGPQDDYFDAAAINAFLSNVYTISAQSDRMGFRLDGPRIEHAKGFNMVSDGTVTGAIQVPGSGTPIVLMADAQTTGGYPKIATVISVDVPMLGRRKPGHEIRFSAVTLGEATDLRRAHEAALRECVESLRVINPHAVIDVAALHTENLISGVVRSLG
jgi:biotin-dependent carboxylase-like uncharacterized protein